MVFRSPYPLDAPRDQSLPHFLFKPVEASGDDPRVHEPLLYPTPASNSTRPVAQPLSLADVRHLAYNIAAALLSGEVDGRGWEKGDVLAIYASNQHDYLAAALGVLLAGGSVALCNPSYKAEEFSHQLRMVRARAVLTTSATYPNASQAVEDAIKDGKQDLRGLEKPPNIFVFEESHELSWSKIVQAGKAKGNKSVDEVKITPMEDTAVYCFSSGTSGPPKAVRLSHANLVANIIQATYLLLDRVNEPLLDQGGWYGTQSVASSSSSPKSGTGRRIQGSLQKAFVAVSRRKSSAKNGAEFHLDLLPLFHCYGLLMGFMALHTATPRVILPRFQLDVFLQTVQKHKVTFCFIVPPILLALAKSPEVEKYDISSLKRVASGAASLPEELRNAVKKRLGMLSTDGYGMSEMSPIISMQNLKDLEIGPGTVGILAPGTEAKVVDPEGNELGVDQEGELWLRGPQLMQGYLNNDEANRNAFVPSIDDPNRFFKTSDVVRINSKGYITITDRLKDVIKYKGFQVSPSELEGFLFQHDRVADCAVLGVKDPKDGTEYPWAFIVASKKDDQLDDAILTAKDEPSKKKRKQVEKEIIESVNSKVAANFKKLHGITWIEKIPKSDAGKILKRDLRAQAVVPEHSDL